MRIIISASENKGLESRTDHHFGRCPYFVLVDVDGDKVKEVQTIDNPYYSKHQPGEVPTFIHSLSADVMISGGMGRKAIALFQDFEIETTTGASGTVQATLDKYLNGDLQGAAPCHQSESHEHGHRHHGDDQHSG